MTQIATGAAATDKPETDGDHGRHSRSTNTSTTRTNILTEPNGVANSRSYLDSLRENGFVVIPSLLSSHLLLALQATSTYLTGKARQGEWPHVRTVPKQYPPWHSFQPGDNIWGVQHLLHPDMPVRDVYAEAYFCDEILDIVKELLGLTPSVVGNGHGDGSDADEGDEKLVMELFNLLVSPTHAQDFELVWHRDDVRPDLSPDEEGKQLAEKSPSYRARHSHAESSARDSNDQNIDHHPQQLHAQYNIALFDDDNSLIVVPGSHARIRTETERTADPYEPNLPGQVVVRLNAGDAVFYDSNILHRGTYEGIRNKKHDDNNSSSSSSSSNVTTDKGNRLPAPPRGGRMTLHGSVGLAGHGNERARQVLQHAVGDWIGRVTFPAFEGEGEERQRKKRRAEGMRDRLVAMGTGEGLGYSLEG